MREKEVEAWDNRDCQNGVVQKLSINTSHEVSNAGTNKLWPLCLIGAAVCIGMVCKLTFTYFNGWGNIKRRITFHDS